MELLEKLKQLKLPNGAYVIFGSGPLLVRNLISAHDLDILVKKELFEKYKNKPEWKSKLATSGSEYLDAGIGIELWHDWKPGIWDTDELIKKSEIIEGFPFAPLASVLKWKKLSNREKDGKHIEIINKYLGLS